MEIRNPKYPWKPSHPWDNCPGCFEQFDLKTCNHCGSGYPDEYVEVESPPTALGLAREEIAELKRQLEGERAAALNYRNDAIEAGKKCDGLVKQRDELLAVIEDAEAGLEFCGVEDMEETVDFIPTPLLALRRVRTALASVKGGV